MKKKRKKATASGEKTGKTSQSSDLPVLSEDPVFVGKRARPSGCVWEDEIIRQRRLTKDDNSYILLVDFKNGYTCNSEIVYIMEEESGKERTTN